MAVSVPKPDQIRRVAERMGLNLSDADIDSYIGLMAPSIAAYNVIDALPEVQASYVVGLPDPVKGQLVAAAIVLNSDESLDAESLPVPQPPITIER
ncbi:MAG: hypothetical protein IH804_02895 [Planctomycetes bacterium]|nr:hypothetical protein [Planctomycetota bacterium]